MKKKEKTRPNVEKVNSHREMIDNKTKTRKQNKMIRNLKVKV